MQTLKNYFQAAWYNIRHHKAYNIFCIAGTALTFIFITIVLEITHSVLSNDAPHVYADQTIMLDNAFSTPTGESLGFIQLHEIPELLRNIKHQKGCALIQYEEGNILIDQSLKLGTVAFVNADHWKINQYKFREGRPFTDEECENKKRVAVISHRLAKSIKEESIIGKKLEFQGEEYSIIGIVDDYSDISFLNSDHVWIPYKFDKFLTQIGFYGRYHMHILFEAGISPVEMKREVANAIKYYYDNKHQEVEIAPQQLYTVKEWRISHFGDNLLRYGTPLILLLLLLIPALNIVTLHIANSNDRAQEIAIRRAMGATRQSSFLLIITENFLLVICGTCIGLLLTYPTVWLIEQFFSNDQVLYKVTLISHLNYGIVLGIVFPLSLLFSLLSGGLPAYRIAKYNISLTLKGGAQ